MKKITLLFLFCLVSGVGFSQTFQWAKQIAGTTANPFSVSINDLRPFSNGHVYVCGSFTGIVDFDPTSTVNLKTAQGTDGFFAHYDSGGNLLWIYTTNQSGNEEAKAICESNSSRLIVAFQEGNNSFLLRRMSTIDGSVIASTPVYTTTGTINVTSMSTKSNDLHYYVGGSFTGTITVENQTFTSAGQSDAFLGKFKPSVTGADDVVFSFFKNYGGIGNDQINGVFYGGVTNMCVGYFENTADFDGDPTTSTINKTSAGGKDCFQLSVNMFSGDTLGVYAFGSTGDDAATAICESDPNIIAGYFSNTLIIDPTTTNFNLVSSGGKDGFVVRYGSGATAWSKKLGGTNDDEIVRVSRISTNSNVYYAAKLGSTGGSATSIGSFDYTDGSTIAFGGIFFPSNQNSQNLPICLAQDKSASIGVFTSGIFNATTDFDPSSGTASLTPISGGNNGFIQKMSPCTTTAGMPVISSNNSVCLGQSLTLTVGTSATLNNNSEWKWYSGSCGGTLVGTGLTINVSPTVQTSYYVRGEGGCAGNGNCSAVKTISITNLPNNAVTTLNNTLTATQSGATYQWVDCNNGNSNIAGATSQSYTTALSGNYAVIITNASGCSITSNCTSLTVCNPASAPTISGVNSVCSAQSIILSIVTGSLNANTSWKWYSDSCGGTLVGTGSSITITPQQTNNIYYARGEGGCVTNGTCSIGKTVTVYLSPSTTVTLTGNTLTSPVSAAFATFQWVNCATNLDISGETTPVYTPTVSGSYAVRITNGGCVVTTGCTTVTVLSTDDFSKLGVKLYPNPVKNSFTIEGETTIEKLVIYNLVGQQVKTFVNTNIYPIEDLTAGTYLVEVTTEKGTAHTKIVKE